MSEFPRSRGSEGYEVRDDEAARNAAPPEAVTRPDKPVIMLKRIGGTTYQVAVHFSQTSTETMNDKITRLIRRETESGAAV